MQYMQYNIYFRKENWELFQDEENKSQLINELLTQHYGGSVGVTPAHLDTATNPLNIPGVQKGINEGLPCCKKPSPCRHWSYNDLEGVWVNSLTGETKDD